MENTSLKTRGLVRVAMIAALYIVLSLAVLPMASGAIQLRVSELLTVLPVYTPLAVPGLTLGCCLFNLIGALTGTNPIGLIDAVVGSLATFSATLLTYWIGKTFPRGKLRYLLAPLPPVLVNAVVIGAELSVVFSDGAAWTSLFPLNALYVGLGQLAVCYLLGIPLMVVLERGMLYKKIFS